MKRRKLIWSILVLLIAGAGAAGFLLSPWSPFTDAATESERSDVSNVETAAVERAALTASLRLNGQLGYGASIALPIASGVITGLPAPGTTVSVGESLYEADGRPVVLMAGSRPLWRDLASDAADGPDVQQLEQNLQALGFFDGEPDERFDWWTTAAIMAWQESLGVEHTGAVAMTDVVFASSAPVRVDQVTAQLGDSGVSPFTYSTTSLRVTVKLTAAQARELSVPSPVRVRLPSGTEIDATMTAIDQGGQPTGKDGETTPPTASIEFADQAALSEERPGAVKVTVAGSEGAEETLVVPAVAILATGKDQYAVEIVRGSGKDRRIVRVPVQIGVAADGRVQILASGADVEGAPKDAPGLKEGDHVVTAR